MAHQRRQRERNSLLSQARQRLVSPSGSGRSMSRQELADAANAYLWHTHAIQDRLNETDVGKLERGEYRWPGHLRREAFRAILGADTDAQLGFYIIRGHATVREHYPVPLPDHDDKVVSADMRRRDVWRLAVTGAALPALGRLAECLTSYTDTPDASPYPIITLSDGRRAVTAIKRDYQACRYSAVLDAMPGLLPALRVIPDLVSTDDRVTAWTLLAEAYHVAGSILLKMNDVPLATLAADRSMRAARRSEDPVAVASSARIITHALMSGGHLDRAHRFAAESARQLRSSRPRLPRDATAVLGALLLRGGVAAARADERDAAQTLLEEADAAAAGVSEDGNDRWTGFNLTNVMLHRVNTALALGDAGTAIHLAKQVDVTRIALTERRACLYLDVALAYRQWGKWDETIGALRQAAHIAPQEITARADTRKLIEDVAGSGPRSARTAALDIAAQTGLRL